MKLQEWRNRICENSFLNELYPLYAGRAAEGAERLLGLLDYFNETFGPEGDISLFSAPGRTEIGGNHTDHQHGCVLAASVNLDTVAAARPVSENRIRIQSEGYPLCEISTDDLAVHPEEKNTTISLIRGIAARFSQEGCPVKGFDAVVRSDVLPGSGLSSSAAFEVLVGNIINSLFFGDRLDAVRIAQFAQYAENVYFGKPSGLMDQMASSIGNILTIDFEDTEKPLVRRLDVDFEKTGLALCIIDTGADHADLTDEYAAIPLEMKKVCACFGREYLRQIPEKTFMDELPRVRAQVGDRAILRAFHIYEDNRRAVLEAEALEKAQELCKRPVGHVDHLAVPGSGAFGEKTYVLAVSEGPLGIADHGDVGSSLLFGNGGAALADYQIEEPGLEEVGSGDPADVSWHYG